MALAFTSVGAFALCAPERVSLRGDWGQVQFRVEVADDVEERAIGLMNRPSMPRMSGMLFVYDAPQRLAFWMRNTLIPLDMIFVDPTGRVAHIHENAIPLDETAIKGGQGLQYVLEINGGMARRLGISVGSEMQHPAFDQAQALWPCPN